MKEQDVFWLGGKPGSRDSAEAPPEAARLEPALREAFRAHGLRPEDFVAALGAHGSWLMHFSRSERRERIVWNGRDSRLSLQKALPSGGWEDLRECPVASPDAAGFAAGIAILMA